MAHTPLPSRPRPRARSRRALLCAALLALTVQTTAVAAPLTVQTTAVAPALAGPPGGHGGSACVRTQGSPGVEARRILDIARTAQKDLDLKAVQLRVTVDGREIVTDALGESMTGVPAQPDMHFRAGSVAFAHIGTALLRLVEERRVRLDDTVERWLPHLPQADRITLRMLATNTTGLHDYVTDPAFGKELLADPFRAWTPRELLAFPLRHSFWYEPGTNWSYSHANYLLLVAALEKITGTRIDRLVKELVTGPLELRDTRNSFTPDIPSPVLHAFSTERGLYEESTFWNPSWTTAPGAVITTHICDLSRSAEAIGSGELLSPRSYRTLLDPGTVGLGSPTATCPATVCLRQTEAKHFGLGVIVINGWVLQNPSFSGYAAIQAYLPSRRLAVAVSTTKTATTPEGNTAEVLAGRIAAALAPEAPLLG
ncbi:MULTISPECIES: serine hydrolase [Streptomyces]|uniref:serine hydrolase domain-containing protein n=1 Tax=Streptomyces TaxID=1883 RepID=UPI00093DF8DB|nr:MULTISPECIES: serine hydrolase domain-containing protein [Streptomyces]MBX9421224.1 beta-lactamase family protein [Streptomyces lateritius]OKJ63957.1 beta-lactamase [Streptomyces sp. CB02261]